MPEVRVNDVKLNYEVQGSGDPLLIVMGLGSSSAAWNPGWSPVWRSRFA